RWCRRVEGHKGHRSGSSAVEEAWRSSAVPLIRRILGENGGRCPFGALLLILEDAFLLVQSSSHYQWTDQILVDAHRRTYDEALQPSQSRHACRAQGARLQPFIPIPVGHRHSGEARLRFRLYRWRAWAVWPGPARGALQDRRTAQRDND